VKAVVLVALGAFAAVAGCAPALTPADGVAPSDALLFVRSNLSDADLLVDGHTIGSIGMLRGGVAVEPGVHHLEVKHDDYFSTYKEVRVGRAEHLKLAMDLLPMFP
jgi:hypothetical protein